MSRLKDIVLDCRHPASLARFWAAVLDGYEVAPYDEAELARLRDNGILDPEADPLVVVQGPATAPRVLCQQVQEAKTVKNRVHLDIVAPDVEAELVRLLRLGAAEVTAYPSHVVLTDPEGNEFCLGEA